MDLPHVSFVGVITLLNPFFVRLCHPQTCLNIAFWNSREVDIRHLEEPSAANHMARLREGMIDSMQSSSLHLDILRDLKLINAHVAAIAHPIL